MSIYSCLIVVSSVVFPGFFLLVGCVVDRDQHVVFCYLVYWFGFCTVTVICLVAEKAEEEKDWKWRFDFCLVLFLVMKGRTAFC